MRMVDFDLPTLGRKILLIVAILSLFVMAEMLLVSAEEPPASVQPTLADGGETPRTSYEPHGSPGASR
jgi:hypothetical protein